jgi:hypothetical protein
MANRPKKSDLHTWAVYHIAARQKLIGYVYNQPDAGAAIRAAIVECDLPAHERGGLLAQRRD